MQISVSSQATLLNASNFFVFALYDASAPSTLLESQQPAKPYGNPIQISFNYNCLSGHIYIIKLWESADSTPSGVVRNSFSQSVNQNINSVSLKMDEYLEVGVTSGLIAGANSYVNIDWAGWQYSLERLGYGTMTPLIGSEDQNYSQDIAGGFTLTQMGDVFSAGEKFVARFIPKVVAVAPPAGTPSPLFGTGRVITAGETLTSSDIGQALMIQSSTNRITLELPAISTISDFSFFYLYSFGGVHYNAVIQAPGSDKFLFNGLISQIILGQGEVLKIFKANGLWNVDNDLSGVKQVGELIYNYGITPFPLNTLPLAGQLINRLDYPRLWNWIVNNLGSNSIVSDTLWNNTFVTVEGNTYYTKKGYFSTGDGSTTFRLPLISSYFIRPIDYANLRYPGSLEIQTIQAHTHNVGRGDSYSGRSQESAGLTGGGQGSNPQTDAITSSYGSTETKPTNIGVPLLIRI